MSAPPEEAAGGGLGGGTESRTSTVAEAGEAGGRRAGAVARDDSRGRSRWIIGRTPRCCRGPRRTRPALFIRRSPPQRLAQAFDLFGHRPGGLRRPLPLAALDQ